VRHAGRGSERDGVLRWAFSCMAMAIDSSFLGYDSIVFFSLHTVFLSVLCLNSNQLLQCTGSKIASHLYTRNKCSIIIEVKVSIDHDRW
jgi:hypothetical protein